jgi:hypothetical protein
MAMIESGKKISKISPLISLNISEWDLFHKGGGICDRG